MHLRVRLFAIQREVAGAREVAVDVASDATVEDAWGALVALVPALAPGRGSVRFAVNGRYSDPTTVLADGDEVACIPPVSGGSGEAAAGEADPGEADPGEAAAGEAEPGADPARRIRILEIREAPFPAALVAELSGRVATDEDGGVVSFVGRTRVSAGTPAPGQEAEAARHAGRRVEALEYEAFEPMALDILGGIADEIEARWDVRRLAIVHRIGPVPLGEASVIVVAAAPHRDAAFAAARYAIDETKARAPIWKAERFTDGHVWVGDLARDGPMG